MPIGTTTALQHEAFTGKARVLYNDYMIAAGAANVTLSREKLEVSTTVGKLYSLAENQDAEITLSITDGTVLFTELFLGSSATLSTAAELNSTAGTGLEQTITEGITDPNNPSFLQLVITSTGTITGDTVVVTGTDPFGDTITENLPYGSDGVCDSGRIFATVTQIVIPATATATETVTINSLATKYGAAVDDNRADIEIVKYFKATGQKEICILKNARFAQKIFDMTSEESMRNLEYSIVVDDPETEIGFGSYVPSE